ncbi:MULTISPECIES: hypothetical protein [unclassified Cryobacterium]|uniref:hypothetical protein n=1 Tax=unclassified Cryobacterium TaxID=2649013 RepID=UPI00106CEA38|nr:MULTISPECIES: hypothetical protein [unclassified Cryobacterium]TFC06522.1 hypothetical protein E3O59_10120 [Cryobacterium sp. MDB2-33-2]TFC15154.1 hypothetical protein E3O51_14240 [Cryobacterium sp. MDB2-10]
MSDDSSDADALLDTSDAAADVTPKSKNDRRVGSTPSRARSLFWIMSPALILVISIIAITMGAGETPKAGWIGVGVGLFGIAIRTWIYILRKRSNSKEPSHETPQL